MIKVTESELIASFTKEFLEDMIAYAGDSKLNGRLNVDGKQHEFSVTQVDGVYTFVVRKEPNE